ncbi:methyl-accepting chemotaxis protein [Pontitalea aquivivens]|uniref:methyl-accepting chemotaxis protein n=1 Tax=Pontitalea aquivivens TaxID=3388663 RepID=UPI003970C6B4
MDFLHKFKIKVTLPLMLVAISALAMTRMGVSSYIDARDLLMHEAEARLHSALEARHDELESWTAQVMALARTGATNESVVGALQEFGAAWSRLGADPAATLQKVFVADNPHPADSRQRLVGVPQQRDYSLPHRNYHPGFVTQMEQFGFSDIYLVDSAGNVIYSARKKTDFAVNLQSGPWAAGALAGAVAAATAPGVQDPVGSPFRAYEAAGTGHYSFVAAPVRAGGRLLGAIVYQISAASIDAMMAHGHGLGETGQSYLVTDQNTILSDQQGAAPAGATARRVDAAFVPLALQGRDGMARQTGLSGTLAEVAYTPVDLFGHRYVLAFEQSVDEVVQPARALGRMMLFDASWMMAVLAALSWLYARSVSAPLARLQTAVQKIAGREYDLTVPGLARGDEVGEIARALQDCRDALAAADLAQADLVMKGAALERGSSAVMMMDLDFTITYVNAALKSTFVNRLKDLQGHKPDFDPERVVGRSMDDFHAVPAHQREIINRPGALPFHTEIAVGDCRFSLDMNEVVMPGKGRIGFMVEWRDVTEERLNRALFGAIEATQIVCNFDTDLRLFNANSVFHRVLGTSMAEVTGRRLPDIVFTEDGDCGDILSRREPLIGRFTLRMGNDRVAVADGSLTPVRDDKGRVMRVALIAKDVTESQRELRASERRNAAMIEAQRAVVESLGVSLNRLSDGDLSASIDAAFAPEYEKLRADFNAAIETLSRAIRVVIENAGAIEGEAQEISNAAEDLSRRTEKQAATLEQTAAALDELTSSVSSAATGVAEANRVVTEARTSAETSGQVVQQAVAAMGEIEQSSQKISRIISVIDDIAFQTNLLALNAGVEAARAGEAGRGFAVVASEVRGLAQRSSEAAREIDALISASSGHVRRGVDLVDETGRALDGILASVNDIAARVSEIAASSQEQSAGLAEINVAVNQLDQVTQQNAAMFEQTTAASHSLSRGAQSLTATMAQFRTAQAAAPGDLDPARFRSARVPRPVAATPRVAARLTQATAPALRATADDWEDF